MAAAVEAGDTFESGTAAALSPSVATVDADWNWDVSADGQRFIGRDSDDAVCRRGELDSRREAMNVTAVITFARSISSNYPSYSAPGYRPHQVPIVTAR